MKLGYTVSQLAELLASREVSSVELTRAYLDRIAERDAELGAYLTVCSDRALSDAERADCVTGGLSGIPFALKDNICTKGIRTTCASRMLEDFVPPYESTVSERLGKSGCVLLGKLNMDEFAMGSTTESSYFKKTRNPKALDRVPGGSSGGAAAAVAADEAPFALGSDTGGSVRQPTAFCGVVGMKPTYGRVSRYGLVAFASSLDQIGPITKDIYDNALVLGAIAGKDSRDATSVGEREDFTENISGGVKGLVIGVPDEFFGDEVSEPVRTAVLAAAERFERLGARLERVSLSMLKYALPAYYIISSAEASSNLARFDGVRYGRRSESFTDIEELYESSRGEGFGDEVKRRIMLGTFVLSSGYYDEYYKKAMRVRSLVRYGFASAFERCDLIISPVAPTTAWRFGEKPDPVSRYLADIFTVPASLAGLPALSMPCGEDGEGLQIGMQLIGRGFSEALIYRAGYAFERDASKEKPKL